MKNVQKGRKKRLWEGLVSEEQNEVETEERLNKENVTKARSLYKKKGEFYPTLDTTFHFHWY